MAGNFFVRSNYSIKLTEEGILLRKRAEEILEMVDKTTEEFKALDEVNSGDIHIGCAESEGIQHFVRVAKKLHQQYPGIRYHFYSSGTEAVYEKLDKGPFRSGYYRTGSGSLQISLSADSFF